MVRRQFADLRDMINKWSYKRRLAEGEAQAILQYQQERFSECLWQIFFLSALDEIPDQILYQIISSIIDSGIELNYQQAALQFLRDRVERCLDQDRIEMIEAYQRIIMIRPHHIKNRQVILQLLNEDPLELSSEIDLPAIQINSTRRSALKALEQMAEELDHSLIFLSQSDTELALAVSSRSQVKCPSDLEISIDAILPNLQSKELEEALENSLDNASTKELQSRPKKPIWGQKPSPLPKRLPIEESIRALRAAEQRQRSYPPHETKSTSPHITTE